MNKFFNLRLNVAVIFVILFFSTSFATEPKFPSYIGFVNDFAGMLDSASIEKLNNLGQTLEKKTSAEMAIVTVKTVAPLDPKTYAVKLFEQWKIGKKGKDNGLLILLSQDERRVEIEVGYGLEGVINDAKAGEILDKYVVPFFKEGKFGEGIYNGAEVMANKIAENAKQELGDDYQGPKKSKEKGLSISTIIILAIVTLIILSIFASGAGSGVIGAIVGLVIGLSIAGIIGAVVGAIIGFMLSFTRFNDMTGGGFGGGFGGFGGGFGSGGGGFGGFGGGGSGGGGSGRSW
ncbi:MAG: TPM domain-containing protein [bacterium]